MGDLLVGGNTVADSAPAAGSYDANLSDGTDLTNGVCRGVYVGTSGHVKMTMRNGSVITKKNVAAGMTHPWQAKRIWSTGTTAADVVVDY